MSAINKNLKITQSNYFMGIELDPYDKKYVIDYLSKFIACYESCPLSDWQDIHGQDRSEDSKILLL